MHRHTHVHVVRPAACRHVAFGTFCSHVMDHARELLTGSPAWTCEAIPLTDLPGEELTLEFDRGCPHCRAVADALAANSARAQFAEFALAHTLDPFAVLDAVHTLTEGPTAMPTVVAVVALRDLISAGWAPPKTSEAGVPATPGDVMPL